jgi:hypothetical protein
MRCPNPMRTTRHLMTRSGGTLELLLDEDTGHFDLRCYPPKLPDPDLLREVRRWCKQIGNGWVRRKGNGAECSVSLQFSTQLSKGKFNLEATR